MHYVDKAILLDEADVIEVCGCIPQDFDELVELADCCVGSRVINDVHPTLEVLSICSERYDEVCVLNEDFNSEWLTEGNAWRQTLTELFRDLGGIDQNVTARFLTSPDIPALISDVVENIKADVEQQNFFEAKQHLFSLENLKTAGLPCFRSAATLTSGGDDYAHDCRDKNYGPGKRIIVEVAYVWG